MSNWQILQCTSHVTFSVCVPGSVLLLTPQEVAFIHHRSTRGHLGRPESPLYLVPCRFTGLDPGGVVATACASRLRLCFVWLRRRTCLAITLVLRVVAHLFVCAAAACLRAAHSGEGQEVRAPRFYGHRAYPHPSLSWGEADQLPLVVGRCVPVP